MTPEVEPIQAQEPPDSGPRTGVAATIRRGDRLELEVTGLAFGGAALAKVDGFVVFVENALPGDRVAATVFRRKRQYAEARAEALEPE